MTNYRNKYKPRKNTPKSERKELRLAEWAHSMAIYVTRQDHTNPDILKKGFGHPVRGRKR